ncbi:uncharacterized protein LOC127253761 [Andrographis paniculata]|uniref:uncharacterized protein LOC127253761 n=1 Tax=Andrographis paniculata TaxID=175694 RepID=UPI0021E7DFAD|nr:uncharacterized protein LOC127253761 [Andrographis paniculata]
MGKNFWRKNIADKFVHALDYNRWNVLKFNHGQKIEATRYKKWDLSSEAALYGGFDTFETAKLLDGDDRQQINAKDSNARKRQSLRAWMKALISEEINEDEDEIYKEGSYFETELQGSYLNSLNVDWKHSVVDTIEEHVDNENPDILEIFKVDKHLLVKNLCDSDETIANFSRAVLGLNSTSNLIRSRSFPPAETSNRKKSRAETCESKMPKLHCLTNFDEEQTSDDGSNVDCRKLPDNSENLDSDSCYIMCLLDLSGIAVDPFKMRWHSSDQPLNPNLFERVEACWPCEDPRVDKWEDFYAYWNRRMLFDLVNEVILEVYDESASYYPKALSLGCRVRLFPAGYRMMEEVCARIGALMSLTVEETMESFRFIFGRDLARHVGWMNLQPEAECLGFALEDAILDELLEEYVLLYDFMS